MAANLSPAKCILLTVHYASSANIKALHSFTPTRLDALDPELILRILLTYLPESVEPREYVKYVEEVGSRLYLDVNREDVKVDISPVKDISEEHAEKKVKKMKLLETRAPGFPAHAPDDHITRFICHRAYRIDEETGLLNLIPSLVEPFLQRNDFIRIWYISVVLPLMRFELEYYPEDKDLPEMSLEKFVQMNDKQGIDFLLQKAERQDDQVPTHQPNEGKRNTIARDVRGLVGPWMFGHTERKRRKLEQHPQNIQDALAGEPSDSITQRFRKIELSGVSEEDKTGHSWESFYRWMVDHAQEKFVIVTHCVEDWDGPSDVDFGGYHYQQRDYLDDDLQRKLELQYAQASFAACYAAQADTEETIHGAHSILARLAELLDFIPPPDLATSVESLPKLERHSTLLQKTQTDADFTPDHLLKPEHPLTTPRLETYMLLQMIVYSAYQFNGLGYPISIVNVAKLYLHSSSDEQLEVLRKLLRRLSGSGARKDEVQWTGDRAKLKWLWNWGIDPADETAITGAGVLGKVEKDDFEEEMLKVFVETSCNDMALRLYLGDESSANRLPKETVERVVLAKAMEAYDGASNGNRTRGAMKKASDIIATFRPFFRDSVPFRQSSALISATHALSFYSLILQHGVPFKPVSIRVSQDPISLIDKVLEQNPKSYTKLDDLIDICQNLVSAGLPQHRPGAGEDLALADSVSPDQLTKLCKDAERRATFMAVQAAMRENDFETAYSYIVNRLTPSGADISAPVAGKSPLSPTKSNARGSSRPQPQPEDDVSWRAAFLAGRYRPATTSPLTLRRLEQRTELLSLALLLAPTSALTEILAAWRRCEEEMTGLQLAQQQALEEFDDHADKRSTIPGNFVVGGEQPEMVYNQERREMGRMGAGRAEDSAPMSMFDLTRSAARAFSRNAFPLSGAAATAAAVHRTSDEMDRGVSAHVDSFGSEGSAAEQQRVRKRDMVASAVSGGLASGLGWVLGATPTDRQDH